MDRIIENEHNRALVDAARARGWKPYIDHYHAQKNTSTPGYYLGSLQLRVRDQIGTRYFINIDMFYLGDQAFNAPKDLSARASVQFHGCYNSMATADFSFNHEDLGRTEMFADDIWRRMSFGYYERDETPDDASNEASA